ncbi:HNH endonuclease [Verrucomicrobiaceae bacterium R5-34]|uniref:HNH endonuclease n=1 Tax=Oceaniferula flava TaxID=2800421 RepID=A0AAE2SDY0_9BACT|nr:HNH endonuclease [Oceaniferula flavus]MBK1830721.1 HNH endonuclease [Verrucomicrobiaceae bacterium R5-34]MBK1855979.1 HNH endonuclease [Oceaniferula flavus]MBM1137286.1 HNH endonuclease [Oceaniferula flavus]
MKLLCRGHAHVVEAEGEMKYQTHDLGSWLERSSEASEPVSEKVIRTVSYAIKIPKVIVLAVYDQLPSRELNFTRHNVFLRDHHTCQYCHQVFPERELNLDHVVPRDKGGGTSWENIVTSCFSCNNRKANKLPQEAQMFPKVPPRAPAWRPLFGYRRRGAIDDSWQSFL